MDFKYSTNIRKKDNGWQYIITYKVPNSKIWKPKSKQGFKTKNEANKAMIEMIPILEKMVKENTISDKILLKDFYNLHLEHLKLYLQPKTILRYENAYVHFKDLGKNQLTKITNLDLQNCVDKMVKKGLKSSSIELFYKTFVSTLKTAKEDYNLLIEVPSIKLKLELEECSKKALDKETISILIKDFKENENIHYNLILLFALEAGLRIGEIMGLTFGDIDLDNRIINVNRQWKIVDDKYDFGKLKSKNSKRTVPLSNNLYTLLSSIDDRKDNNRIIKYKSTKCTGIKMSIKLKPYGITTHELRHTFCTQLLINGLDIGTTAKIMGHTTDMTLKIYNHIQKEHLKKASDIINNIF